MLKRFGNLVVDPNAVMSVVIGNEVNSSIVYTGCRTINTDFKSATLLADFIAGGKAPAPKAARKKKLVVRK